MGAYDPKGREGYLTLAAAREKAAGWSKQYKEGARDQSAAKDIKRGRVLSNDELAALMKPLPTANLSRRTVLGLWLILASGCRIGELMGAVWADAKPQQQALQPTLDAHNVAKKSGAVQLEFVDLTARTWYLPTTKNQRDHLIHPSDFTVTQFTELAALREADCVTGKPLAWVFPDSRGTGPVCVKSFGKKLADRQRSENARLQNRTKSVDALVLEGGRWTAHDLRRTARSMGNSAYWRINSVRRGNWSAPMANTPTPCAASVSIHASVLVTPMRRNIKCTHSTRTG